MNCNKIPFKDKGCHFIVGVIISAVFCLNGLLAIGLFVAFIIGISKELFDKYIRKTFFDIKDVLATSLGSIFFTIAYIIFKGYL